MQLPEKIQQPVLIKILRKEYVDDLLDGNLYMNNLKYFVDLEKETGVQGVGDIREASFLNIRKHELFIKVEGEEERKIEIGPPPGIIYDTDALYHPVFCCVGKVFNLSHCGDNKYKGNIFLPEDTLKDFVGDNDNDYISVIIINCIDFLNRVYKAINELGIGIKHGLIKYRNRSLPNIKNGELILDDTFTKDIRFENQSEFRIELFTHSNTPYTLKIGDIRHLAFSVECRQIVDGLCMVQTIEQ